MISGESDIKDREKLDMWGLNSIRNPRENIFCRELSWEGVLGFEVLGYGFL